MTNREEQMKRILLSISLILLIQTIAFTNETMTIECENITIEAPLGWLAQYTKTPQLFILYSPLEANDTFQENCNLTLEALPTHYTVPNYMEASINGLKTVYSNLKLIESKNNYHIISGNINNIIVKQIQYFYIKNNTAYILTFTSNPENFNRYLAEFESIAQTLKY